MPSHASLLIPSLFFTFSTTLNPTLICIHRPSQQFGRPRDICGRHIIDLTHPSQGVLDHEDIALFQLRLVIIFQFAQQNIGRRQVHEIFSEDG
ncbi:hypothetical protein M405DRAFT_816113, partial [Rhizopogon salebrosus TDB-379]